MLKTNFISSFKDALDYFALAKVDKKFIVLGAILAILLMFVNLYSVSLLFPLANSLITKDFSNLAKQPLIGGIVNKFPTLFSNPLILFGFFGLWLYGTILLKSALKYGLFICTNEQSKKASLLVREAIFERYLLFGKKFYDNTTINQLNQVLLNSTRTLKMQLDLINSIIVEVSSLLVSLVIMFTISWELTLLVFIIIPLQIGVSKKAKKGITTLSEEYAVVEKSFTNKIMDILQAMPIVKGYSQEKKELESFSKVNALEVKKDIALQRRMHLFQPVQEILSTTTTLLVAGAMGFIAISNPNITPANAIVFLYMLLRLNPSLNNISTFDTRLASIAPQAKRLKEVFDDTEKYIIKGGETPFKEFKEKIEFKNLFFEYDSNKPVLKGVTFSINKKDKLALIGPSGAGKTTIINLLLRFYDCPKESIFIDGIDINEYKIVDLKSKIAFVSQETILFNDTIEANVLYGNPNLSKEKLDEILEKSMLSEKINSLKEKEQTMIGEKGANLSGGEKQRIALARALAKDAEIIILDEPTSALDPKTEEKIAELMHTEFKDKTVIVIAHRPAIIQKVNKIALLEDGKIVEYSSKEDFDKKNGLENYFNKK
ncbi:MAG: ABC transporter ATP-binding protein [Candidatus Iainarchaeum sp.]|jgi:subfamily B ATP-binding cassette protein MsbA